MSRTPVAGMPRRPAVGEGRRQSKTGLTTGNAPLIDALRAAGTLFIEQPYEQYSAENHETWRRLMQRMRNRWEQYANDRFREGVALLCLDPDQVPRLDDVNKFLAPRTGFKAVAVSGYIAAFTFFDSIRRRQFPTTITIRSGGDLDYLPEPDIFHDIAGHVPMHTDPLFADVLVRFGECARAAVTHLEAAADPASQVRRVASVVRALARFFWFTVEFGLMRGRDGRLCAYGSGLLSSHGEIAHAIDAPDVRRQPFQMDRVVNQPFDIDRYQPLLFIVESFDHLFELVGELERWMHAGRLDDVAGGEPVISERDLTSFVSDSRGWRVTGV